MSNAAVSLVDFARKQKQRDCPVCKLDADTRAQLRIATDKAIRRQVQIDWLKEVQKVDITSQEMTNHYSGKHDD